MVREILTLDQNYKEERNIRIHGGKKGIYYLESILCWCTSNLKEPSVWKGAFLPSKTMSIYHLYFQSIVVIPS